MCLMASLSLSLAASCIRLRTILVFSLLVMKSKVEVINTSRQYNKTRNFHHMLFILQIVVPPLAAFFLEFGILDNRHHHPDCERYVED